MHVRILMDNNAAPGLEKEWGLAVWIEVNGRRILLDAGHRGGFAENARKMGVKLADAELAVLSHAHYDHANGFEVFLRENAQAKIYIRDAVAENCYDKGHFFPYYIGIRRGMMAKHPDRFVRASGVEEIRPGVWLVPHASPDLGVIGKRAGLYVRRGWRFVPDDFAHEQSLVLETETGLVVFNSCSHGGPDNIVREVEAALPGRKIRALIGGLHLFHLKDEEVRALAGRVKTLGIERIYTDHCTGDRAIAILQEELGEAVQRIYAGMEIEL